MPPSTSSNDAEHDIDLYAPYALADSYAHSYDYDRLQYRKRATRLVITPGGVLQHYLVSYPSTPFNALLAAGAGAGEDVSPAAGPPDTSASFRSAPQELLSSPPAANDLHTSAIAQEEKDASPPLRFETPEPFLGDHDDPNRPFRPAAPPSVHNHQEHDGDNDDDAASPPDVKVILSSEAPGPSPVVQGTRRATSSPACTSTPPASAYTIHPTTLISTSTASPSSASASSSSSAPLPTNEASSIPLQSSLSLLPTAVVANTSTSSTGAPLGIGASGTGTAVPASFSALHTVPFYVSVVFGSIAAAALLAALVAWAFRFRSAARVRREERIFGFRSTGNAGGGDGGDGGEGDGGGWAAWWSRPFMNRVGSGRESLATMESEVADSYVSARPQPIVGPPTSGVVSVGVSGVGVGVGGGGGVGVGGAGGIGGGGAVPEGVWREWEHATGMSFGREMGVGSGTDMAMQRTVSSKRRHQARAANAANTGEFKGDGDGGEFGDEESGGVGGEFGGVRKVGGFYVHPPPQTYDAPTQPLENPFNTNPHPHPHPANTTESALARSSTRESDSARSIGRGRGRGRVGLPRMDSLGSGVGLGLGLEFSGSSDLDLSAGDGRMGGMGGMGGMGSMGSMLRVMNRAEGDGISVNTSRAGTALGMHEDGDGDRFSMSHSPTTPSPSTPIPASASTSTPSSTSTARPSDSGLGGTPSTRPLPLSSFPSFPSMLNAIKTTFGAAFSPSVNQGRGEGEEDRFTRAPERCGVKKTRKWAQMGGDVDIEEEKEGEGEKTAGGTKPLSVPKKHSRRYPAGPSSHGHSNVHGNSGNAKQLSLMRGVSARRVRDSFPVGLAKRGRGGMRRLGSSASRMSRAGGSSMGASRSQRGSREGWEDLDARSDSGDSTQDSTQDNDYGGNGDEEEEEDDGGRPRFLSRPSAASFLSSVSGVSVFSVDSVNSSREALVRERA